MVRKRNFKVELLWDLLIALIVIQIVIAFIPLVNHRTKYVKPCVIGTAESVAKFNSLNPENPVVLDIQYSSAFELESGVFGLTKTEIDYLVKSTVNSTYIIHTERKLNNGTLGYCMVPLGIIVTDSDLQGWEYATVLAHELIHYKMYTVDERYTEYMTFVELWESSSPYLRYCAMKVLIRNIGTHCKTNGMDSKYDALGLITQYLLDKNVHNITWDTILSAK